MFGRASIYLRIKPSSIVQKFAEVWLQNPSISLTFGVTLLSHSPVETTHSKRNSALDWLSDLPSTTPQKRLSGTCEWILQTDEFHAWLGSNPDKQYLWLKGNGN
jgi:hypothetical protein